ncbi:MAG: toll/interleukin-1 receptor domain-containing protein, partial [Clostridia bacterium]|nr:toll/interleukin-1 receptor domain-containing protein [Clostridia bacterium]
MDNFTSMQCKNCGNNLYSKFKKRGNDFVCGCCGSWFRSKENEDTHCESGYAMLNTYHFDEAKLIFQNTITENPDNIDALWGWLLAEYRIIFVKGFYNDVIEPIYCFDQYEMFKTRSILNEIEYEKILKLLADDRELLNSYREKAEKIDRSMAHFKECKNKTENDVFICVKISTSTEKETRPRDERTKDFEFAEKLYKDLKAKGKKPFFSFYTLKNQVNSDDLIWTSLVKSKKMVLIGSKKDYFESVWVESEWKRWIFLDRMPNLYILTLPEKNQAPYDILPTELASNQIYTQATYNKLLHDLCEKPVLAAAPKKRTGTKAFFGVLGVCGVAAAAVLALGATGNLDLPFLPAQTTVTTVQSTTQGGASTVQTTNTSATTQTTASTQGTVMPGVSNTTQTTATTQGTTHEHSYGEWLVTKKATCTENGEKTRSCSCGAEENQDIPAAHNEITIPGVKPTCTKDGLTDGKKCIICGETTLEQVTAFS